MNERNDPCAYLAGALEEANELITSLTNTAMKDAEIITDLKKKNKALEDHIQALSIDIHYLKTTGRFDGK